MQTFNNKIILVLVISLLFVANVYAKGKRKNFLSHGPSVSSFAQGETVLNNLDDPSIIFYNPSLLNYFDYNTFELSRYNLFNGTSYNSAAINYRLFDNFSIGFNAIDLASGDVELREDPFDAPKTVNTNQWAYILAVATEIKSIETAVGVNAKYIYLDLYEKKNGGYSIDAAVSKFFNDVNLKYFQANFGLGFSAQNFYNSGVTLDEYNEKFQNVFLLSTLMQIPVVYHFSSKDTITFSLDVRNEDSHNEIAAGVEYKFIEKFSLRGGYYTDHITAGFGAAISSFIVNYSIDFNELDIINRFSVALRWGKRGKVKSELDREAKAALNQAELSRKQAEKMFNEAKKYYSDKQYLYATDLLQRIIMDYPDYESPNFYYNKIKSSMAEKSDSELESNFEQYSYSSGYVNYYKNNYYECLKQWSKYLQFDDTNEEVKKYYNKVDKIVSDSIREEETKEFEFNANNMLNEGIMLFKNNQWISCIKKMETLQNFVKSSKYTSSFNYYSSAKQYIAKSVEELSKTIKKQTVQNSPIKKEQEEEIVIDEKMADSKYKEGLILYAKGKYLEAERMFELALRLNPNHQKAKNALKHMNNK